MCGPRGGEEGLDAHRRSVKLTGPGVVLVVVVAASASAAPACSPSQAAAAARYAASTPAAERAVPAVCLVTGGTGFVGARLVEMLVERGARRVISFDIVPPGEGAWQHEAIEYVTGDICDAEAVSQAVKGVDCVWHNAAAVGPFHPQPLYHKVNYLGTVNVVKACKQHGVTKIVMSSSPSTRFDGSDVDGLTEAQMPALPLSKYMQAYAETKAMGEVYLSNACSDELMTVAVAPHQVYGPRDNLFMPNILEAAGSGKLRVFSCARTGYGFNRVCFTHVDNYAHGLIIAERALYKNSPALGKFYIVTDGDTHPFKDGYAYFWVAIDEAVKAMGFLPLFARVKLPDWLLFPVAYLCELFTMVSGIKTKLNIFNVTVLTMHRWFAIDAAEKDLGFKPIIGFHEGWADMCSWFKANWLPGYAARSGKGSMVGIAAQSQRKIDIQGGKKA